MVEFFDEAFVFSDVFSIPFMHPIYIKRMNSLRHFSDHSPRGRLTGGISVLIKLFWSNKFHFCLNFGQLWAARTLRLQRFIRPSGHWPHHIKLLIFDIIFLLLNFIRPHSKNGHFDWFPHNSLLYEFLLS